MTCPKLFRKRLIPCECIELKDDLILHYDEDMIVTSWKTLHPKKDLHHGCSVFYRREGWKISRFYREDGSLMYVYCDIISCDEDVSSGTLTVVDLLADVLIYPDGFVKVVDLDELAQAVREGLMSEEQLELCLITLNSLLTRIYGGGLDTLCSPLDRYCPE